MLALVALPAPAAAAPAVLPPTDAVFTIECDIAGGAIPPLQLFSVDPATAVLSAIGSGDPSVVDSNCAGPAATHPVTGTIYVIDQSRDNASLTVIDETSGSSTVIAEFRLASDGVTTVSPDAIAIRPNGDAVVVYQGELYSLALATGLVTLIGDGDSGATNIYALAAHPVTGVIYGVSSNGPAAVFTFDPVSGEATSLESIMQNRIFSMAFDSTGTLWVTNYIDPSGATELATVDPTDWVASYSPVASMTRAADPTDLDFYVQTLFITSSAWPSAADPAPPAEPNGVSPELAATGSTTALGGVAPVIVLLIGVGGAFLITARWRRRRP